MNLNFFFICFVCFLSSVDLFAQTRVKMQWENGWYTIPCSVNGLPLKAIYDSKVGVVNISISEAMFMLRNGYLDKEDIINTKKKSTDNELEAGNSEIVIRLIDVGGVKVTNVKASVVRDMGAPMLFGASLLRHLGYVQTYSGELIISKEPFKPLKPKQMQETAAEEHPSEQKQGQEQEQLLQAQAEKKAEQTEQTEKVEIKSEVQEKETQVESQSRYQSEFIAVSAYKDNDVELAYFTDIQQDIDNEDWYHVWVRREYFGEHKEKYIKSFAAENKKKIEQLRLEYKKKNQYFDPIEYYVDFKDFRYNWALYIFDFTQKQYKMAHLIHYDESGNVIKDTGFNPNSNWDSYEKAAVRMKTLYDAVYNYMHINH